MPFKKSILRDASIYIIINNKAPNHKLQRSRRAEQNKKVMILYKDKSEPT